MTTKKPDRFDKMAGDMTYTRESLARNIAKLLRRQHRAVLRLVRRQTILAGGMLDRGVLIEALKEGKR